MQEESSELPPDTNFRAWAPSRLNTLAGAISNHLKIQRNHIDNDKSSACASIQHFHHESSGNTLEMQWRYWFEYWKQYNFRKYSEPRYIFFRTRYCSVASFIARYCRNVAMQNELEAPMSSCRSLIRIKRIISIQNHPNLSTLYFKTICSVYLSLIEPHFFFQTFYL